VKALEGNPALQVLGDARRCVCYPTCTPAVANRRGVSSIALALAVWSQGTRCAPVRPASKT
jgi:hypothetical protein